MPTFHRRGSYYETVDEGGFCCKTVEPAQYRLEPRSARPKSTPPRKGQKKQKNIAGTGPSKGKSVLHSRGFCRLQTRVRRRGVDYHHSENPTGLGHRTRSKKQPPNAGYPPMLSGQRKLELLLYTKRGERGDGADLPRLGKPSRKGPSLIFDQGLLSKGASCRESREIFYLLRARRKVGETTSSDNREGHYPPKSFTAGQPQSSGKPGGEK